jgi:hypothetical protein
MQKGGLEPVEFKYGFLRNSNITGIIIVGSELDRCVQIRNLELLWKAALIATLCAVENTWLSVFRARRCVVSILKIYLLKTMLTSSVND